MSSDEEYLDSLLKSIIGDEEESGHPSEKGEDLAEGAAAPKKEEFAEEEPLPEELSAENIGEELPLINDFAIEETGEEDVSTSEEFAIEDIGEEDASTSEDFAIKDTEEEDVSTFGDFEIEDTGEGDVSSLKDFAIEDFGEEEETFVSGMPDEEDLENSEEMENSEAMSSEDIEAMFAAADEAALGTDSEEKSEEDAMDDDLAEISGLLRQSGDDAMTDDDMLALLESMSMEEEHSGGGEEKQEETVQSGEETENEKDPEENAEGKEKKKKRGPSGLFGKKKKKKEEKDSESLEEEIELIDPEENMDFDLPQGSKKKNLFSMVLSFLTEADEEETDPSNEEVIDLSDENRNILEELDEEDRKKKKKKVKGKKGKKGEKQEEADAEGEEEEEPRPGKKKKKEKKGKKEEVLEEIAAVTKPARKVSPKNIGIIAGLCLTFAAVIIVFSSVVPGFFDKRNARDAYYQADYSKSFELLYGKKLDNSDTIIFNKSKIILQMNRKLDSYHNYISMGKEVEALDALLSGIERYPDIYAEAEEYHVTQEVSAVYETVLTLLADKFGLSEAEATEILDYDDLAYTLKLESIVNGTPFVMPQAPAGETKPGEETESPAKEAPVNAGRDILPEEQELLEGELPLEEAAEPIPAAEPEEEMPKAESVQPGTDISAQGQTESGGSETGAVEDQEAGNAAAESEGAAPENGGGTQNGKSGSQGQLIQGLRQPLEININQ